MSDSVSHTAKATYEGNVLRLHQPLPLSEQQRVWVVVVPMPDLTPLAHTMHSPDEILRLAAQVYENLSPDDVDEIERLALDRSHFFAKQE